MARFNSSNSAAGYSLVEAVVATGLMAGALASLGQMFAISIANNVTARAGTYATVLAEQKMEQLRGLTWGFDILITGRAASGNSAAYNIRGAIKNNLGAMTVVGSVKTVLAEDDATWDANVAADQSSQSLVVRVTGPSGGPARWVASVRSVEVSY